MKFIKLVLETGFISLNYLFSEFNAISFNFQVEKRKGNARMQMTGI